MVVPALAEHVDWRPAPVSRLAALETALAPVHTRLAENMQTLQRVNVRLGTFHDLPANATAVRDIWLTFQAIPRDGLSILDQFPPEPCFSDLWAIERTGWLYLGDSTALFPVGGLLYGDAIQLLVSDPASLTPTWADQIRAITDCGGTP